MRTWMRGALTGAAATTAMSVPMALGSRFGESYDPPPETITETAVDAAHVSMPASAEHALALASHFGYGTTWGVLYALIYARRRPPGPPLLHGIVFALLLWALSYSGWIPALGIMPPPARDQAQRRRTVLLSHVVYGAVLGALGSRRRR